jgi:hypothetical protein
LLLPLRRIAPLLLERQQLPIFDEDFRVCRAIGRRVAHIVDDAHDAHRRSGPRAGMPVEELSDRAGGAEELPGNGSADHNRRHRSGGVSWLKFAAIEQAGAHRREISRTDSSNERPHRSGAHVIHGPPRRDERADGDGLTDEKTGAGEAGGCDIRDCSEPGQDLVDRVGLPCDGVVRREHELKREHVGGACAEPAARQTRRW